MSEDLTILIVEPHPAVVDVITRTIQEVLPSAHIVTASDGVEGLFKAKEYAPHLLIVSLTLPNLAGHDLVRMLRQVYIGNQVSIIGLSDGYVSHPQAATFFRLCDASLTKPFYPSELQNLVARLLVHVQ